jgi:hypothetical protein
MIAGFVMVMSAEQTIRRKKCAVDVVSIYCPSSFFFSFIDKGRPDSIRHPGFFSALNGGANSKPCGADFNSRNSWQQVASVKNRRDSEIFEKCRHLIKNRATLETAIIYLWDKEDLYMAQWAKSQRDAGRDVGRYMGKKHVGNI